MASYTSPIIDAHEDLYRQAIINRMREQFYGRPPDANTDYARVTFRRMGVDMPEEEPERDYRFT